MKLRLMLLAGLLALTGCETLHIPCPCGAQALLQR